MLSELTHLLNFQRARRSRRTRTQAQNHRQRIHRRFRCRSTQNRRRKVACTGHNISRLHRVAINYRHNHQKPPQCRRSARKMNLRLCEPLRLLFKDEVRAVGRELGMPEHLISRHPFPGPGLAVRILGDITPEKYAYFRKPTTSSSRELR